MEGFKEFQGKDLDSAIEEACGYFDAAREKLEIEIVQDSKSGIFGIVGARKAKVRARRVQLRETVESIQVHQGIFGRILNYGSLVISGAGNPQAPIPNIANPMDFRRQATEAIEEYSK